MASTYSIKDPSFKDYYSRGLGSETTTLLKSSKFFLLISKAFAFLVVPICQYNQCCQYGSENVWLLHGRKNTKEIGQNQGRYSQSKISFPPGREVTRAKPYHKMTWNDQIVCVYTLFSLNFFYPFYFLFTHIHEGKSRIYYLLYYTLLIHSIHNSILIYYLCKYSILSLYFGLGRNDRF